MTILEIFTEIRDAAIELRKRMGVNEYCKVNEATQTLEILIGHPNMLVIPASREKPLRRRSVIVVTG